MFGNFKGIGEVDWDEGSSTGTYFPGINFVRVADPQCNSVTGVLDPGATNTATLQSRCNALMQAVAVQDGSSQTIVLQNVQPGTRGNLGVNTMEGPGLWSVDASLSKAFQISESKRLQFRFDAANIFNHATPCAPVQCPGNAFGTNLYLNALAPFSPIGAFGQIGAKNLSAARQFQATVRFDF